MYQVELSFPGLNIGLFPRFLSGDNLFGTTRPITFLVGDNVSIRFKMSRNTTYVIKFTGGKSAKLDGKCFSGIVENNGLLYSPIRVRWEIKGEKNSVGISPPCSIRPAILGFI